jgi:hypothetical protein
MSLRQASLLQGLRCATKNGKYDFTRSNGYLGLYPIWLRRPRDTKAKWLVLENLKTGLTLLPKSASSKPPCLASSSLGHQSQMGYKPR